MAKILFVDDEFHIRELMRKTFSQEGYQVTTVPSAEQALEVIFKELFDLIVLDIHIAGQSGLSLLRKIREQNTKIPVVIYSACVTADIENQARTAGATETLRKDIGMAPLIKQINKIIQAKDRITAGLYLKKNSTVLVVDDQENIRNLLSKFFADKGYEVLEASHGQEAMEMVRTHKVSAVLLDIDMPVMDGLTALSKLLEINPRLGIVMTTGNADDENVKTAIERGAYGYVLKPFDFLYLQLVVMSRLAIAES